MTPGDTVQLTPGITGKVVRILDDMAEVREERLLGRPATWRVKIEALRPMATHDQTSPLKIHRA
jgi:preprotein translocase subunit YajC